MPPHDIYGDTACFAARGPQQIACPTDACMSDFRTHVHITLQAPRARTPRQTSPERPPRARAVHRRGPPAAQEGGVVPDRRGRAPLKSRDARLGSRRRRARRAGGRAGARARATLARRGRREQSLDGGHGQRL